MTVTGGGGAPRAPLALTPGDPAGIGPEVALEAARAAVADGLPVVLVGAAAVWQAAADALGVALPAPVVDVPDAGGEGPPTLPRSSAWGGRLSLAAIERAIAGCLDGTFGGIVTAPISKESINLAGSPFPGHTELLASRAGGAPVAMMLVREHGLEAPLRVGLVTIHVPLRAVAALVTPERVGEVLGTVAAGLRQDWGIAAPRLALLGLNPHAGDGGVLGNEENDVLRPALDAARRAGLDVEGPFPADAFFGRGAWRRFDAVVACYHDQGLAPFKALAMGGGVNVTAGLPFIRTSPDHGTAFDVAGQGRADASSMTEAVRLAAELAARRFS
ncbi:MAG TPA: 4-hydroxythreonine-4-phosphate dehydrogenase PdxA [Rhodothermales bacterium]|nr:4-hydroxythreonine-4-phosphate dehydrogenase PdxA [Rhodothermales bacterium]